MKGIVRTLCQSDAQLFAGWGSHACVGDAAVLEKIDKLANKTATLLKVFLLLTQLLNTVHFIITMLLILH